MSDDAEVRARATESLLEHRALRPRAAASTNEGITPNDNLPAEVPPGTVGADGYNPGDPIGFEVVEDPAGPGGPFPRSVIRASPWSGWPADWETPLWGSQQLESMVDTAWKALDLNASLTAAMPPYILRGGAAVERPPMWIQNPNPDLYTSWHEFFKQVMWDYQMGETFILMDAPYENGFPARFHVVDPWLVNVEMRGGRRVYNIGSLDVTDDILHIRYKSRTADARGHGPLEAGRTRLLAAALLQRYAGSVVSGGGVPNFVIKHPRQLTAKQSRDLQAQWYETRAANLGLPAVLSGGIEVEQMQISPRDMTLVELSQLTESRLAVLLDVPPFLVGLPSGGDSMTYANVQQLFLFHWRAGLRTKVVPVMAALSQWLLPYGTDVELNSDQYVQPELGDRAAAYAALNAILDADGQPVLGGDQIRQMERFTGPAAARALTGGNTP